MQTYANLSGNSGVAAFEIQGDAILVDFHNGKRLYRYSYATAGVSAVEEMKRLAFAGSGLSSYIAQHKPGFEK